MVGIPLRGVESLDANAVVAPRFTRSEMKDGAAELLAVGTVVVIADGTLAVVKTERA